jgi:large subunit ribosomal protein L35
MPKQKTKRGAAKRFSVTAKGKVKRAKAFTSHILSTKSPKRKRKLRQTSTLANPTEARNIKQLIPYK